MVENMVGYFIFNWFFFEIVVRFCFCVEFYFYFWLFCFKRSGIEIEKCGGRVRFCLKVEEDLCFVRSSKG